MLARVLHNIYFDGNFSMLKTFEAVSLSPGGNSWLLGATQG